MKMHLRESRTSKFPLGLRQMYPPFTLKYPLVQKPLLICFYLTFLLGMTFHTQRGNCSNIKKEICCHILGDKTLIKRFELSETKKEKNTKKKTLKSDSSYPLLKNWALKSVIQ